MCFRRASETRCSRSVMVSSLTPDCIAHGFESPRGAFCRDAWSWVLQRSHLTAGDFAVIVGGAVASSPLP
eukprot:5385507-Prymnesium_polylepis.1